MDKLKPFLPFLLVAVISIVFTIAYNAYTVKETTVTADGRQITRTRGFSDELKKLFPDNE